VFELEEFMRRLIPTLALLPLLGACEQESRAEMKATVADLKAKTSEGVDQAKESISKAVAEFQESSDATLSKIDEQLAVYRDKARDAGESAKANMKQALADLEEKRRVLAEKKAELGSAPTEQKQGKLAELKSSLAAAQKAIEDSARYFKSPD
jgi:hypothetical protein